MAAKHKGLPIRAFRGQKPFAAWLAKHHATIEDGLWVKFAKKASGLASITYEEAREVAIIYGWIDGLKNSIDGEWYAIRFTPRRSRSKWSKINRDIAEALIAAKKMKPAGRREVEAAQADGRWEKAYLGQAAIDVPADLRKALAKVPAAKKAFAKISSSNRYAILYSIHDAKREATRTRRIAKFVTMLAEGELPHPDR